MWVYYNTWPFITHSKIRIPVILRKEGADGRSANRTKATALPWVLSWNLHKQPLTVTSVFWLLASGFFITRSRHKSFTPSTDLFSCWHYSAFRVFSNRFLFWCQYSVLKIGSSAEQLEACPLHAPHALALAGTSFPCSSPRSSFEQHSSSDHTDL